jgi:hypothetical protein
MGFCNRLKHLIKEGGVKNHLIQGQKNVLTTLATIIRNCWRSLPVENLTSKAFRIKESVNLSPIKVLLLSHGLLKDFMSMAL